MKKLKKRAPKKCTISKKERRNTKSKAVINDMEKIDNEDLPKKNYIESPQVTLWCREKGHKIFTAICDRDCKDSFCTARMELLEDYATDYQSLNGIEIKKALISAETQRRLFLYLNDGRLIKILGGFQIHNEEPPNDKKEKKLKKPQLKRKEKSKNNNKNNRTTERSSTPAIKKKKLKFK